MFTNIFPWILYLLAWGCTLTAVQNGAPLLEYLLLFVVFFNGGIQGLWSAVGHLGFPKQTARKIGWKPSEFQTEIGFANLAIGLVGVSTIFYAYWAVPVGLILVFFFIGCAYTHVKDHMVHKNKAPLNWGPMLVNTFTVIVTIMACIILPICCQRWLY